MKLHKSVLAVVFFFITISIKCQDLNSIYSAYGIGDINIRDWNAYTSMGGLGVAMKSERTLNNLNPASYAALKDHRFLLELAASGTSIRYITSTEYIEGGYFGIKRAAFGMNLFKNLGTVFGIRQFSKVEYQSIAYREIAGTTSLLQENIQGNGGINLAYIGNGYKIGKHVSVGLTVGALFGSVNKNEQIALTEGNEIEIDENDYYQKFYFNTGLQYEFNLGKFNFLVGGIFQPTLDLNKESTHELKDGDENIIHEGEKLNEKFSFPLQIGGGITISKGGSKLGFDYIRQNWSKTGYNGTSFTTNDLQNFAIGYNYTFYKKGYYGPIERISLMAGFQKELSYLIIKNQQVNCWVGTLGVNIPSKRGLFNYTVGIRAGQRGEVSYPLVKEKFVDFTFNVSLGDFFYIGRKKYD